MGCRSGGCLINDFPPRVIIDGRVDSGEEREREESQAPNFGQ